MAANYIGSVISLVTNSDIRWEGILFNIDTATSEIQLQGVRSFGTEGRKRNGPQIPPSPDVYDFIKFKGADIKELNVLQQAQPQVPVYNPYTAPPPPPHGAEMYQGVMPPQPQGYPPYPYGQMPPPPPPQQQQQQMPPPSAGTAPTPQAQPPPPPPPSQPQAEKPTQAPKARQAKPAKPLPGAKGGVPPPPSSKAAPPPPPPPKDEGVSAEPAPPPQPKPKPSSYASAIGGGVQVPHQRAKNPQPRQPRHGVNGGRGMSRGHFGNGRQPPRQAPAPAAAAPPPQTFTGDFDFEMMNTKFNKETFIEREANAAKVTSRKVYERDDFFDTMSCEALERAEQGEGSKAGRGKYSEQRKIDLETFHGMTISRRNGPGGRGGGRGGRGYGDNQRENGGGRGGRGRGRGRGRGPVHEIRQEQ